MNCDPTEYTATQSASDAQNGKNGIKYHCGEKIFTISNGISGKECQSLISRAEKSKFNKSSPSGGGHGRTGREDARTSQFIVFPNESQMANTLYNKIKDILPADLTHLSKSGYITSNENAKKWYHVGINPYSPIYKYEVGQ